jgi:hypothetical protein
VGSLCRPVSEKERVRGGGTHRLCSTVLGGGVLSYWLRLGGSGAEARGGGALLLARIERGVLFLIGNKQHLIVISCLVFSSWA